MIRILLVDTWPVLRLALSTLLDSHPDLDLLPDLCVESDLPHLCIQLQPDLLIAKIEIITSPTWLTFTERQMIPSVYILGVVETQAQASLNVDVLLARNQIQSLITLTDSLANWESAIQATGIGHTWLSQPLLNLMLHQLRAPTKPH